MRHGGSVLQVARSWLPARESFEQLVDELFDELLINRWRIGSRSGAYPEVRLLDFPEQYEVQIAASDVDPNDLEVEATSERLRVIAHLGARAAREHVVRFAEPIDPASARARWFKGLLTVTLPKQGRSRRA